MVQAPRRSTSRICEEPTTFRAAAVLMKCSWSALHLLPARAASAGVMSFVVGDHEANAVLPPSARGARTAALPVSTLGATTADLRASMVGATISAPTPTSAAPATTHRRRGRRAHPVLRGSGVVGP